MKKRVQHLLSALLALCMAFGLYSMPASATEAPSAGTGTKDSPWDISAETGTDNVSAWYEGSEENGYTLIISGEGSMADSFRSIAPPWKSIKSNITAVEIRDGVINVGAYAFNFCKALKNVSLPESLTEIGSYAFHSTGIKHLTIPVNVETIGRMIANPTTYFEVLGNPENVNNHAFSTSLVSAADKATAEALNAKTNVSALIVLNGGIYGETDEDLENLSYGLIAPVKADSYFGGWYQNADFSGQRLAVDRNGRTTTNINNIYYAKWSDTPEPTPVPPTEDETEVSAPADAQTVNDAITLPDGYTWQDSDADTALIPGGIVTVTAISEDGSKLTYKISKNAELIYDTDDEYEQIPGQAPAKHYETGVDSEIVIKSTGVLEKLQEVKADGKVVDKSHYTLKSGSTILTLTKTWLDTLSAGEHTIEMVYEAGSVEVLLRVTSSTAPDESPTPAPSDTPGESPTPAPSGTPDESPTPAPSGNPGESPTPAPSGNPGESPTPAPSGTPGESPTPAPSGNPGESPAPAPSGNPGENPTPAPSDQDTATPSPTPSQTPSGPTDTPPDNADQSPSENPEPGKADSPDPSGTMHSPKTGDYGNYITAANDTAESHVHGTNWFLFVGATAAAILLGTSITILMRRKYGSSNDERRNDSE